MDLATPPMQVTALGMAEVLVTVEATAGAAVFGEGSGPAWDGTEAMEEASVRAGLTPPGEAGMVRLMDPTMGAHMP